MKLVFITLLIVLLQYITKVGSFSRISHKFNKYTKSTKLCVKQVIVEDNVAIISGDPAGLALEEISDEELALVEQLALGDSHVKELSNKVEEMLTNEWETKVTTYSNKLY